MAETSTPFFSAKPLARGEAFPVGLVESGMLDVEGSATAAFVSETGSGEGLPTSDVPLSTDVSGRSPETSSPGSPMAAMTFRTSTSASAG